VIAPIDFVYQYSLYNEKIKKSSDYCVKTQYFFLFSTFFLGGRLTNERKGDIMKEKREFGYAISRNYSKREKNQARD
jgi:hypothetical protein